MSQKTVFDRIYSIILLRGKERSVTALESMFKSYCKLNDLNTFESEDVIAVKNELIEALNDASDYKDELAFRGLSNSDKEFRDSQKISKNTLKQDLSLVENTDTIFYNKKVVLTGVFSRYPVRDNLADVLKKFGADINTSISKKTDLVCLGGVGVGPSKMAKIEELKNDGFDIRIIEERELYNLLDSL